MLGATSRVLKPSGVTSFSVITEATDDVVVGAINLARADVARTIGFYSEAMIGAGFEKVEVVDATQEYEATLEAWIREWEVERSELTKLVGEEGFVERQTGREEDLAAVREGTRWRLLVTGTKPGQDTVIG